MDHIFIRGLRVETVIGVNDWERQVKQAVSIDLEMGTDIHGAAESDKLDHTLDYKVVAKRLIQFVGESRFQLIETLAERVATLVMREFGVPWLRLTLSKPGAVRGCREVGVTIERGANSHGIRQSKPYG